ncbi:MAG: hypothetical protein ACKOB6_01295, partial [Candidatus Kapaibacterium sp.]
VMQDHSLLKQAIERSVLLRFEGGLPVGIGLFALDLPAGRLGTMCMETEVVPSVKGAVDGGGMLFNERVK